MKIVSQTRIDGIEPVAVVGRAMPSGDWLVQSRGGHLYSLTQANLDEGLRDSLDTLHDDALVEIVEEVSAPEPVVAEIVEEAVPEVIPDSAPKPAPKKKPKAKKAK